MKKILLALSAVALLFATSCKKDQNAPENITAGEGEFLATIDNGANPQNAPVVKDGMSTMTTINSERFVIWETGDEIKINGSIYTTDASGSSVIFSGGNATGSTYHAFFPASIAGTDNAGTLPATQTIELDGNNNITVRNLPMYATSTNNQLTFHNICAALKIEVPAFVDGATRIEVSSDKALHGTFTIGDNFAATVAAAQTDADKMLTVKKQNDVAFATNEVIYIAVPAQSYKSLKVEFFNGANSLWTKTVGTQAEPIVLAVNKIYNINATPMGLCFTALAATNINMDYKYTKGGNTPVIYLEYCIYNSNAKTYGPWNKFIKTSDLTSTTTSQTGAATTVTLAAGDKVFFRAGDGTTTDRTNTNFGIVTLGKPSDQSYFAFTSTGNVEVSGNIMYLLSKTPSAEFPQGSTSTFYYLFSKMNNLIKADGLMLPATTLVSTCHMSMFNGCSNLTAAPALPATTLADSCYYSMFNNCSNLTAAPALPATTLADACYCSMFSSCYNLTAAPALPVTTLAPGCYNSMFSGCRNLTAAPALPATSLVTKCYYQMFLNCIGLTSAPALPATTLAAKCYNSMFKGCSNLTTAPVLPATTLADTCYRQMFNGCTNLAEVTMKATNVSASMCLADWLNNAGTSSGSHILYVDDSMTTNSTIVNNKGNFTIQSYNPPSPQ